VAEHCGVKPARDEIRLNVQGVNHFTWANRARYKDLDLIKLYARHWSRQGMVRTFTEAEVEGLPPFHDTGQVGYDMFRRFGILPAIGARHLVEFVPFYLKDVATLARWGVKMTLYGQRLHRYVTAPRQFRGQLAARAPFRLKRSGEEAVAQIMALLGLGDLHTNVNLPNIGQMEGLPRGAVVETNACFTEGSVTPEYAGRMPPGAEAWVSRAVSNQELITEAALTGDRHLAFQAFLNDPLMSLTTDRAWKMFSEMLRATGALKRKRMLARNRRHSP
jgi:galacturan 1,4-alpha-galacturonidase